MKKSRRKKTAINSNKKGNKKMTVVKATFKIGCCYEVENNILEVISSDAFADKMRDAILELTDTAVNPTDICIQTPDDSLVYEYTDNKDLSHYVGMSPKEFYAQRSSELELPEAGKGEKSKGKKK